MNKLVLALLVVGVLALAAFLMHPYGGVSVGILGGADGPTSILVGKAG